MHTIYQLEEIYWLIFLWYTLYQNMGCLQQILSLLWENQIQNLPKKKSLTSPRLSILCKNSCYFFSIKVVQETLFLFLFLFFSVHAKENYSFLIGWASLRERWASNKVWRLFESNEETVSCRTSEGERSFCHSMSLSWRAVSSEITSLSWEISISPLKPNSNRSYVAITRSVLDPL